MQNIANSNSVGSVAIDLFLNNKDFNRDVSKNVKNTENTYKKSFSNIAQSGTSLFNKLGKLAVASGLIYGMGKFGKQAVQLGSDLEEVQNVVDVVFNGMTEKVNSFSQNAITTAGLSETVAKKYMGTYGAMNKSFGFTTEQSFEMSKAITQLTGDVASFYNLSNDLAYTKLKSIWTGETETLKDLGVVMTQNALDQYALANGYGKTTDKMSEQEKVALRYAFVQQKLAVASGDFARTQDGWANQTRVLTLRWQQFMATVGQGLINIFTPVVKMLNLLIGKLQVFANAFKNFTEVLFGKSKGSSATSTITDINSGLSDIGSNAIGSANDTDKAAKKIKRALGDMDELNIINNQNNSSSSLNSGGLSNGVENVQMPSEIDVSGGVTSKLAEKLKELMQPLKEIDFTNLKNGLNKIKEALKPLTKKLCSGLEWLWQEILVPLSKFTIEDWIPEWFETLANVLKITNTTIELIKPGLEWLWEKILKPLGKWTCEKALENLQSFNDKLEKINQVLNGNFTNFGELFLKGLDFFNKPFSIPINGITNLGIKVGNELGQKTQDTIKEKFKDFKIDVMAKLLTTKEEIARWGQNIKTWWGDKKLSVQNKFETSKGTVSSWWNSVKTWWGDKRLSVKNKLDTARTTVSGWWSSIKTWWGTKTLTIKAKISDVTTSLKKWINTNFIDKVNSKLPSFLGKIPRLASGGYAPRNNPQLAIIGDNTREGEIVSPESKIYEQTLKAIKDSGSTSKQEIEITIYHKYEDGRTIIQKINQAQIDAGEVLVLT